MDHSSFFTSFSSRPISSRISLNEDVWCAEFAPYDWCCDMLCILFKRKIVAGKVTLQFVDEGNGRMVADRTNCPSANTENKEAKLMIYREFVLEGTQPVSVCWSPDTLCGTVPLHLIFCVALSNWDLNVYISSIETKEHTVKELPGHTAYINSVMYHPSGQYLASGSDDFTCRIWNVKDSYSLVSRLMFRSCVMSVRFHSDYKENVLVALKSGMIHMMNVALEAVVYTLSANGEPLLMADWAPSSSYHITTFVADEILLWDSTPLRYKSRFPGDKFPIGRRNILFSSFAPWCPSLIATFGGPDRSFYVKIIRTTGPKIPTHQAQLEVKPNHISWHKCLPVICLAVGKCVHFLYAYEDNTQ